jgi:NAD-dependent histone deacetylase SIR2
MQKAVREKSVPHCVAENCNGLVKPDIVFFGEQLPSAFFANRDLPREADLCLVMGTSLSVQPFASLPSFCADGTPRVLINQEQVGGLGSRPDDVLVLGDCDAGVRKLAEACGWLEELEEMWTMTAPWAKDAPWLKTAPGGESQTEPEQPKKTRDEKLEEEVDQLTREVDESLKISEAQHRWLENHVGTKFEQIQIEDKKPGPTQPATVEPVKEQDTESAPHTKAKDLAAEHGDSDDGLAHVFPHINKKPAL